MPSADGRTTASINPDNLPSCTISDTCNYWKQNGNAGIPAQNVMTQLILTNTEMASKTPNTFEATSRFVNCVWCIPAGNNRKNIQTGLLEPSTVSDVYTIFYGDLNTNFVVESLEYFMLMNRIEDISKSDPSCPKVESNCGADPIDYLRLDLDYINCRGDVNNVSQLIYLVDIFKQEANIALILPTSRWDYIKVNSDGVSAGPPLGNAIRGSQARWYSFKYNLDNTNGTGIDQCTLPTAELITYNGTSANANGMKTVVPSSSGAARNLVACDPKFTIKDISDTNTTNEIQIVNIPVAAGGTYDLIFTKNTVKETAVIPYNARAAGIKAELEKLSLVGAGSINAVDEDDNNVSVEFVGKLAATALPLMGANSKALTGTYFAYSSRLFAGTRNERQTIANVAASYRSFQISLGGYTTTTLTYDSPMSTVRAALESLPNIGGGNIRVSGSTTNTEAPYTGPWQIDFIGALASTNMPKMTISNSSYSVITDWIGGIGINEKQSFTYKANRGSYQLRIFGSGSQYNDTEPIKYNATPSEVKAKILKACTFLTDNDIQVLTSKQGNVYTWTIEYVGNFASTPINLCVITSISLEGDSVSVTRFQAGGGKPKRFQWNYQDVLGGFYVLKFELVDGSVYLTDNIQYNATADEIKDLLERTTLFDQGDVAVTQNVLGALGSYEYVLLIKKNVPSIKITAIYGKTLLCNPVLFEEVPSEPYDYQPIYCPDQYPKYHGYDGIVCLPYPPEDALPPQEPCCTVTSIPDNLNRSTYMKIERDLFDPNMIINGNNATVGGLMASRNYKKSEFVPFYLTSRGTCLALVEANYTDLLKTRTTIIIVSKKALAQIPRPRIIERVRNPRLDRIFCDLLPSQLASYSKTFPDILPGKNYDIS
jgi:hypothetical protein